MTYFFNFFCALWFIRGTKTILFWLYLWQLKEYHSGRFLDHFRTAKGKKLLLNPLLILKIILFFYALTLSFQTKLLAWQLYAVWILILLIVYCFEAAKFFQDFVKRDFKKPVLTPKATSLISFTLICEALFLFIIFKKIKIFYWVALYLLSFDILTPFIALIIVLCFQVPTVVVRNQIIKKAQEKREKLKNLITIGITGSYGKTSTKEMLATILSEKFKTLKTQEHQNSEIGIAQCVLSDLKPEHEIFVCEIGAYNKGKIKEVCRFLRPQIGILTGINEQHMATFGSLDNIIKTKYELIESLPQDGLAIFNGENKYCLDLYQKTKIPKKLCGKESTRMKYDLRVKDIKMEKEYTSFKVFSKDRKSVTFKVNLLGAHNVENLLMAATAAKELEMTLREISLACKKIKREQGGIKFLKNKKGFNIIDSSYSANPNGVIADLDYLKLWEGKKIIIMPCLIELGKAATEVHKRIGQKIGETCDLAIITTKDRFKEIREGAIKSGMKEENILFLQNPKEIFKRIENFCKKGDTILLEGRIPKQLINSLI